MSIVFWHTINIIKKQLVMLSRICTFMSNTLCLIENEYLVNDNSTLSKYLKPNGITICSQVYKFLKDILNRCFTRDITILEYNHLKKHEVQFRALYTIVLPSIKDFEEAYEIVCEDATVILNSKEKLKILYDDLKKLLPEIKGEF